MLCDFWIGIDVVVYELLGLLVDIEVWVVECDYLVQWVVVIVQLGSCYFYMVFDMSEIDFVIVVVGWLFDIVCVQLVDVGVIVYVYMQ